MSSFSITLYEGLNAISIPLILSPINSKWDKILGTVAVNSVRTIINGEWKDYIRGRSSSLNDFDSADHLHGYLINVIRTQTSPIVTGLLPASAQQINIVIGNSVYNDQTALLNSLPLPYENNRWLVFDQADATNTSGTFCSFTTDRPTNIYLAYQTDTTIPTWLEDWEATNQQLTSDNIIYDIYRMATNSGGAVVLGGNHSSTGNASKMYLVFVQENLIPIAVATPVSGVKIVSLNENSFVYPDRLDTATDIPEELENLEWISTPQNDYLNNTANYLQFSVTEQSYIYVAYQIGLTPPTWLNSFECLNLNVVTTTGRYVVYRKYTDPGTVILPGARFGGVTPVLNYLTAIKRLTPPYTTITLTGDEPFGINEIPLTTGLNFIGFPKSASGDFSISTNIDNRNIPYSQLARLNKNIWQSYVPHRDASLNWSPANLERGQGYILTLSGEDDILLGIDYES